jgi:hypothetical protein
MRRLDDDSSGGPDAKHQAAQAGLQRQQNRKNGGRDVQASRFHAHTGALHWNSWFFCIGSIMNLVTRDRYRSRKTEGGNIGKPGRKSKWFADAPDVSAAPGWARIPFDAGAGGNADVEDAKTGASG